VKDFSNRNLQKMSFVGQDLRYSHFTNSDIRGADFSGANLNGVDFTGARTGIPPMRVAIILFVSLIISLLSGYFAMLGGKTVQLLILSKNEYERTAGSLSMFMIIGFFLYAWLKGGGVAIRNMVIPIVILSLLAAAVIYLTGIGTGRGMFFLAVSLILVAIMFIIGTIARTAAGSLSNILFLVVALSGGMFGRSVGGGIGTLLLALACALISKRALHGDKGFAFLRRVSLYITSRYGTSFRNAKMSNARFYNAKVHNADFSHTDISLINWGNVKRVNCTIIGENNKDD
jgi:hypothetical protein